MQVNRNNRMWHKQSGGRPRTDISDATRERILALRGLGVPTDDIPRYVDVGQYLVRQVLKGLR